MKSCCSPSSSTTGSRYGWILLSLTLALSLALGACTKDATLEGPALVDLFGDFQVLETVRANRDSVRFGQGETVYLQGRFNKLTDWRLEVHGLSSGARKIIQGKSPIPGCAELCLERIHHLVPHVQSRRNRVKALC